MSDCTYIIPSNVEGQISGVRCIVLGARSVKVQLFGRCVKLKRSALPRELPVPYMELADIVRPIALRDGIDCNSIL